MQIKGNAALVTGAASGMGEATACYFGITRCNNLLVGHQIGLNSRNCRSVWWSCERLRCRKRPRHGRSSGWSFSRKWCCSNLAKLCRHSTRPKQPSRCPIANGSTTMTLTRPWCAWNPKIDRIHLFLPAAERHSRRFDCNWRGRSLEIRKRSFQMNDCERLRPCILDSVHFKSSWKSPQRKCRSIQDHSFIRIQYRMTPVNEAIDRDWCKSNECL